MTSRFVPPSWLLAGGEGFAEIRDLLAGARLRLEGELVERVLEGQAAALSPLAALDPTVQRFAADLARAAPAPLTRDAILRGGGWRQLFLELGARCNERCVHCYAESSPERTEELSLEEVLAILDDAKALGFQTVQLTGGDPLIAPSFLSAATHATRLGFESVEIYTNGLALRGALFDALVPLRPAFAFSFYSHDPEVHDAITRTPGSQVRTAEAIRAVVAAGLRARASIIALEANHHDLDRTVAFVRELGIDEDKIGLDVQREVGRGEFADGSRGWSLPRVGAASAGHRTATATGASARTRFGGTACVGYDGIVYPCIFSRHLPLGDVREGGLRAVLEDAAPLGGALDSDPELWREKLACLDCRVRSALLSGSPRPELVPLRTPQQRERA